MKKNYRNASNNTKFKSVRFSDYNHDNHERLLTNSMRINIFYSSGFLLNLLLESDAAK